MCFNANCYRLSSFFSPFLFIVEFPSSAQSSSLYSLVHFLFMIDRYTKSWRKKREKLISAVSGDRILRIDFQLKRIANWKRQPRNGDEKCQKWEKQIVWQLCTESKTTLMRSRLDGRKHTHKVTQRAKKNDREREYECNWMMMKRANVVFVQTFRMIVSVLKSANVKCLTVYFYSIPSYWKQCFNQIFEIFSLRLRHSFVNNCSQCYSLFVSVPFRSVCVFVCE